MRPGCDPDLIRCFSTLHLKVFFGVEKGRGGCCVHFSVYFVASLGGSCVGFVMRSLWERFTTPVREGTKGADKSGVMEQHAKRDFKMQGRKKGPDPFFNLSLIHI